MLTARRARKAGLQQCLQTRTTCRAAAQDTSCAVHACAVKARPCRRRSEGRQRGRGAAAAPAPAAPPAKRAPLTGGPRRARRKGLSEERARRLFRQLLVGLDFCTRMGLSNLDVRLENTLLDRARPGDAAGAARAPNGDAAGAPRPPALAASFWPARCRAPQLLRRPGRACQLHSVCHLRAPHAAARLAAKTSIRSALPDRLPCWAQCRHAGNTHLLKPLGGLPGAPRACVGHRAGAPAGGAEPAPESAAGSSGRPDGEPASANAAAPGAGAAREGGAADAGSSAAGGCREDEAVLKLCAFGPSIRAHHSQPWRQDGGSLCYNRARPAPCCPWRPCSRLALRAALRLQAALSLPQCSLPTAAASGPPAGWQRVPGLAPLPCVMRRSDSACRSPNRRACHACSFSLRGARRCAVRHLWSPRRPVRESRLPGAAPEALISRRFEATADEAATVWICGVFLYAMLCNQYPVRARAAPALRWLPPQRAACRQTKTLTGTLWRQGSTGACWPAGACPASPRAAAHGAGKAAQAPRLRGGAAGRSGADTACAAGQFGDASNVRAVLDVRERMMKGGSPASAPSCLPTSQNLRVFRDGAAASAAPLAACLPPPMSPLSISKSIHRLVSPHLDPCTGMHARAPALCACKVADDSGA